MLERKELKSMSHGITEFLEELTFLIKRIDLIIN